MFKALHVFQCMGDKLNLKRRDCQQTVRLNSLILKNLNGVKFQQDINVWI